MFEIKIRMMNENMAKKLMSPLALGVPDCVSQGVCTYLSDEQETRVVKEFDGVRTYAVVTRHQTGFSFTDEHIDDARAEDILRDYPPKSVFEMTRSLWERDGVSIALNVVKGLGVFLEFQGMQYEKLKTWPKKIGFGEAHYLTRAYDELS